MPHLPHAPLTLYILDQQQLNPPNQLPDYNQYINEWSALAHSQRAKYLQQSDTICKEYYQCLNPAASTTHLNDRVELVKEIILKHSAPTMQTLIMAQQALVDAVPKVHPEWTLEEYFEAVSCFVNQLSTFKGAE